MCAVLLVLLLLAAAAGAAGDGAAGAADIYRNICVYITVTASQTRNATITVTAS